MSWFFDPLPRASFDVILIDVPWRWKNYSMMHNWRSPEAKYLTMTLDEAAALPVRELLAPGGCAVVWMTWPLIADASMIVQNSWGLSIRTGGSWAKRAKNGGLRMGTGLIWRGACEPILIATNGSRENGGMRGRDVRNFLETFEDVVIDGLAREHSRKPEVIYEAIEKMTPGWRRADIFTRERRAGWSAFGNQVDLFNGSRDRQRIESKKGTKDAKAGPHNTRYTAAGKR